MSGEAKRRREALARGDGDPGVKGLKSLGRWRQAVQQEAIVLQRLGKKRAESGK
jgi:hypothetical protein